MNINNNKHVVVVGGGGLVPSPKHAPLKLHEGFSIVEDARPQQTCRQRAALTRVLGY